MTPEDQLFFELEFPLFEPTPCSPDPDAVGDGPGIVLAAPSELPRTSETFPLCGTLRLSMRTLVSLDRSPIQSVVVLLTDVTRNRMTTVNLTPGKTSLPEDRPPRDPNDYSETDIRTMYFCVDLYDYDGSLKTRLKTGNYIVFAVIRSHKSAAVTVRVIDDSAEDRR